MCQQRCGKRADDHACWSPTATSRRSTVLRLGRAGFEVLVARDGEEAVARARSERPDVCVIDAMTPKLTGWDVTRRLRADPLTRDLPVLLMTAQAPHRPAGGPERGPDGYLPKPCSPHELRSGVRAALVRTPRAASRRRARS